MTHHEDARLQRKARLRVFAKKGFFIHFGVFAIVSLFFFIINILTGPDLWFYWPVISWGLAVAIHYLVTFGVPGTDILSQEWEEREYAKEMYILQRKKEMQNKAVEQRGRSIDGDELELKDPVKVGRNWDEDLV